MKERFHDLMPEFEMEQKAELVMKINELKRQKNAVILGHNYMEPALYHFVADETGDSLELCRKAAASDKPIIVFLGVEFMAETAKLLNPTKTVLLPAEKAGCSLAQSITAEDVRWLKSLYPGVPVVTYINTYADVKAETDVCCTSSNAAQIVEAVGSDQVIFLPDEYLARNVARETGRTIIFPVKGEEPHAAASAGKSRNDPPGLKKHYIGWHGKCEVHDKFTVEDIRRAREQFPDVKVLAHPECRPEVVEAADYSGSTSKMIQYVKGQRGSRLLILTECSMADNIIAESGHPANDILRLCSQRCPYMAQITLEQTLSSLQQMRYVIEVPEEIAAKARRSIDRMLELSR
jgi:quinolinate synthase